MKQDTCIKTLEVELTEDETLQFGKLMAENQIKVCKWEAIKKKCAKNCKEKIDNYNENVNYAAARIHTGKEMRKITCAIEYNYTNNEKIIIRTDTGEIVEKTPLANSDLQEELL